MLLHRRWLLRALGTALVGILCIATPSHSDPKLSCDVPAAPLPGSYTGSYRVWITGLGGEPEMRIIGDVAGEMDFSLARSASAEYAEFGSGDVTLEYRVRELALEQRKDFVTGVTWSGSGHLDLEAAGKDRARAGGKVEGSINAWGVGQAPIPAHEGSVLRIGKSFPGLTGNVELEFEIMGFRSMNCDSIAGDVEGEFLDVIRKALVDQGINPGAMRGEWEARLSGDNEVRREMDRLRDEARDIPGKPRPNAILRYRRMLEQTEGGGRTQAETLCLKKAILEVYLDHSRQWLRQDLGELRQIVRATPNDDSLRRMRRLIGQIIGRVREAELMKCDWPERETGLQQCADGMDRVVNSLLKQGRGVWDEGALVEVMRLARDASLLGNDNPEFWEGVRAWAKRLADEQYRALVALDLPGSPQERAAFQQAAVQAVAAERQALYVGTSAESSAAEYVSACRKNGKC